MTQPTSDIPEAPPEAREVILLEYDPSWEQLYEEWRDRILNVAGDHITEIHHIGSTAVPGMLAQPVIDIMPGIAQFEDGFSIVRAMQDLGFQSRGEFGNLLRHFFNRTDVHVHVYPVGQGQWHEQLTFRDHLRTHEDARIAYMSLKRDLQHRYRYNRDAYTEAKSDFIASIFAKTRTDS
jgi:GrpB-like predicted nucleotidyltransferase (UPF0157 family)